MKKLILLIAAISSLNTLNAQNYSEGIATEYAFTTGTAPVIQIRFDKVSKDNVKKAIDDIFKVYKSKVSAVKDAEDEYLISGFTLETNQNLAISKMKIIETNGNATLYAYFKDEESVISEELTPNDITNYKNLVKLIANKAVSKAYAERISKQKKKVKDEEKQLSRLKKEESNKHKNISKYESNIKSSNQEIEQLNTALSSQEVMIQKNNELLKAKKTEIAGKSVKGLNSNISDLKKDNKSLLKSINKHKEEIAEIKGEIAILNSSLKGNETEKKALKSSRNIDKQARKKLKSLNKDGLKLLGKIEENKISVVNIESSITNLEGEIKTNENEITLLQTEITEHNEDALKEQLKLLEKEAKNLNQNKKGLEKDLKKENESINNNKEKIRVSEDQIKELEEQQEKQKAKVDNSFNVLKDTESAMKKYE